MMRGPPIGHQAVIGWQALGGHVEQAEFLDHMALRVSDNFTWYEPPSMARRCKAAIIPAAAKYPVMRSPR
jgi:hypothetical protein